VSGDTVPSVDLGVWRTPVERAPRLAARIGLRSDDLWVKRDDWLGLGGGGSKLRKLEFLCAHALEELGATVLVTGGVVPDSEEKGGERLVGRELELDRHDLDPRTETRAVD
jgi:L-cysteate sulfo-lyase